MAVRWTNLGDLCILAAIVERNGIMMRRPTVDACEIIGWSRMPIV